MFYLQGMHILQKLYSIERVGKKGSYLWCEIRIQQQVEIRGNQLCGDARQSQEKNHYNELILTSLNRLRNKPKTTVTYGKTVKSVSEYNHVPLRRLNLH